MRRQSWDKYGASACWIFLTEWFDNQDKNSSAFKGLISRDEAYSPKVEQEIERQRTWIKAHDLSATPTILVDDYLLPDYYQIEDLLAFQVK